MKRKNFSVTAYSVIGLSKKTLVGIGIRCFCHVSGLVTFFQDDVYLTVSGNIVVSMYVQRFKTYGPKCKHYIKACTVCS